MISRCGRYLDSGAICGGDEFVRFVDRQGHRFLQVDVFPFGDGRECRTEMMGDQKLIHLRLTSRTQQVSHLYLDAVTFLDAKMQIDTAQMKLDQQFLDYREQDGIKVPFLVRTIANGVLQSEMKLETVEFNATIDEAVFRMPKGS